MIIKEKTIAQAIARLHGVPSEKRRVIILAGRHPNEGSLNIANRHHEEWEQKGAVVLAIPGALTPQGFFKKMPGMKAGRIKQTIPHLGDDPILKKIRKAGFEVPIVNFHGTPLEENATGIDYETASDTRNPRHPRIAETTRFTLQPNELLVEYYCRGNPGARRTEEQTIGASLRTDAATRLDELRKYLNHPKITKEGIARFSREYSEEFAKIIGFLAEKGLKKISPRKAARAPGR
ncbi:hypothetical protein HY993_00915 [Candidatus Micrarchaeota archaeon]|nr:hypothetical protein [Candidatus Micrarchaeota archaeon]